MLVVKKTWKKTESVFSLYYTKEFCTNVLKRCKYKYHRLWSWKYCLIQECRKTNKVNDPSTFLRHPLNAFAFFFQLRYVGQNPVPFLLEMIMPSYFWKTHIHVSRGLSILCCCISVSSSLMCVHVSPVIFCCGLNNLFKFPFSQRENSIF